MKISYVIDTPCGKVSGFDPEHQCINFANSDAEVMHWEEEEHADDFLELYSDAGYGLSSKSARVRRICQ